VKVSHEFKQRGAVHVREDIVVTLNVMDKNAKCFIRERAASEWDVVGE
jgi:hypothetical protein